ncbi:extracellular solute-binding protein family 1 [Thermobaculum terrenum ATCC BAA-798]|uniref:Extracellular solute-binding protein family 1 n=1 Tax=Thermobaculum terrenum (strain ATCC BAA-798 / CCMEE 7001 / YNP1) TaxID=525904 RepID=D1CI31_THET1|nr:sugar ABC transporter substrate-binding protein [Thermobaculum terrenum]ACZ43402.1 extracellular solute-binding protein family 1 [Thermobaculum terrenum ATCC BAA-798]
MTNRSYNRRQFIRMVGVAAATGSLWACGGAGSQRVTSQPTQATLEEFSALMWQVSPTTDRNFKQRAQTFNDTHKGRYKVNFQLLPYDQYWQKIPLAYSANRPYDVYFWDVQAYGHFKKGMLLDVQPYLDKAGMFDKDKYPTKLFEVWRLDGSHMYAVPENIQTVALYYNQKMFDQAGIKYPDESWTWDDFLATAQKLTIRQGNKVVQWGVDPGVLQVWWGLQVLSWDQGSAFFDKIVEPTKFQMQDPVNIKALQFVQDLIWKEHVAPNAAQRASISQNVGPFQAGRTAMFFGGSWDMSPLSQASFKWGMVPWPKWNGKRVTPYWLGGWVISKKSKVPDAAFEWARWSATDFQMTMAKQHDWIPILNSARLSKESLEGQPQGYRLVLDAVTSSEAKLGDLYTTNNQQIVFEVFGPVLDQLWNNKITPEQAAKTIDEKANKLL